MSSSTWNIIHLFSKVGFMDISLCFIAYYYYWLKSSGKSVRSYLGDDVRRERVHVVDKNASAPFLLRHDVSSVLLLGSVSASCC